MDTNNRMRLWIRGARINTLPIAISPVIAGTGAAAYSGKFFWWVFLLALAVSLFLTIGVNYANDYSDGIRGTDTLRQGPQRLVGSQAVSPQAVLIAAIIALVIAALSGACLALLTHPWLIGLGVGCLIGAWWYTGGKHPYGYYGWGEVAVFVFFGLIGVCGTEYTHLGHLTWVGVALAIGVGCFASAILLVNNLRDIPTDRQVGKKTLAVHCGDARTRQLLYLLCMMIVGVSLILIKADRWCGCAGLLVPPGVYALKPVWSGEQGQTLIPVLAGLGILSVAWSTLMSMILGMHP